VVGLTLRLVFPSERYPPDEQQALRHATSELQAARARVERDAARALEEMRGQLIAELLPVLDNFDRSISAGAAGDDGVRLVRDQLEGVLRGYGLERFDAVGAPFDPRAHDAIAVTDVDDHRRDGVVVEQWEPGYRFGDRMLRPARVVVGRARRSA
jgi:molecular chaperone GrpE (heat shock protein)